MKVMGINDFERDAAVQWLGENLGYNFGIEIDLRNRRKEAEALGKAAQRLTPLPEKIIHVSTPTHAEPPLALRAPVEATYVNNDVADDGITIQTSLGSRRSAATLSVCWPPASPLCRLSWTLTRSPKRWAPEEVPSSRRLWTSLKPSAATCRD